MLRIVCISDTHSYHRDLKIPDGDVLVHAGDITWKGELPIIEDFSNWLKELPHAKKVIIFGNHEIGFQYGYKRQPAIKMIEDAGAIHLDDTGIDIDGVYFHGSAASPRFYDWEYNYDRGKDIAAVWAKIPEKTNVLITHGPPYMLGDEAPRGMGSYDNVGCKDLLEKIDKLPNLKLHVSGHIHEGYGIKDRQGVKIVNASSCTGKYKPTNPPIVVDI